MAQDPLHSDRTLFDTGLPAALEAFVVRANPWWVNEPQRPLPPFKRWLFEPTLQRLTTGLASVTVVRGPRQVGKTTLQEQIIEELLTSGKARPSQVFRIQFDELPVFSGELQILRLVYWFERKRLGQSFNAAARAGQPAYIFLDEVQNLADWAPQIKALVDQHAVRVLLTGSSALRIERGRDSLAGRITTVDLGPLLVREIAALRGIGSIPPALPFNGLEPLKDRGFWVGLRDLGRQHHETRDAAFAAFSLRGGYPVAHARADRPWEETADLLNETVIKRVIQHDLWLGERGRKRDQNLLEELFRFACRYMGQAPSQATYIASLRQALHANLGWRRVLNYLNFLNDTLLLRLVSPLELRLKRKKGNTKLCVCDHGLRASWLQEYVPISPSDLSQSPHLSDLAGHVAESVAGYFLSGVPGLGVAWFPERGTEPEVDFVLTIGDQRIPVEIKYRRKILDRDTLGLRAFIEKSVYGAPFGVLVTLEDSAETYDPRIVSLPLSSLLLLR